MRDMHSLMLIIFWIILAGALLYAGIFVVRGLVRLRGSDQWPAIEGTITAVRIQQSGMPASSNVDYQAVIEYQFSDSTGRLYTGQWSLPAFSSESKTRDFSNREMPIGKTVVVEYDPKHPKINNLELDSWTYADDRPLSLDL
jgi:hypothetical protein